MRLDPSSGIVLDANVLAKTVLTEPESPEVDATLARLAKDGFVLWVLPLTRYELGNVLLQQAKRARVTKPDVIDSALTRSFELTTLAETPPGVAAAALRHGLTFYDGAYLALALRNGAPLWTFDDRLGAAAASEGHRVTLDQLRGHGQR